MCKKIIQDDQGRFNTGVTGMLEIRKFIEEYHFRTRLNKKKAPGHFKKKAFEKNVTQIHEKLEECELNLIKAVCKNVPPI